MYRIEITDRAKKEIAAFKRSDIASYKKIAKLLQSYYQNYSNILALVLDIQNHYHTVMTNCTLGA